MKRFFLILITIFSAFTFYAQDAAKTQDIEKRLEALEKKNKELEIELDEQKRSRSDNSADNKNAIFQQKKQWGKEFGFEFSSGQQGIFTQGMIGIVFPKINNMFTFGIKGVFNTTTFQSMYFDKANSNLIKYSRLIPGGSLWFSYGSPMLFNFIRFYGVIESFFGSTIGLGADYGLNFTFGVFGLGGIEFYTTKWTCIFIEAGGGWMNVFGQKGNVYIEQDGSNGSGFGIKFGTRIFLAKK